ncbi:hypothetical protein ACWELV_21695 [Streptomyces mirabilis]
MTIQPIETSYDGHRFRSRLEARWAVFFNVLDISWEYESQGYVLDGTPYLPDFKLLLPDGRTVFAEIKNAEVSEHHGEHVDLCRSLARESGAPVLLLVGPPGGLKSRYRMYHQFTPDLQPGSFTAAFFQDYGPKLVTADAYWFQQATVNEETGVLEFQFTDRRAAKAFGIGVCDAVNAARAARFEHGDRG